MRLLLDTQIVYWLFYEQRNVPAVARRLIADADEVLISAVAIWEIAIKVRIGRLVLPDHPRRYVPDRMRAIGAEPLPVEHAHALAVAELPMLHRDPFDRILVAQARQLRLRIVTADAEIARYDVRTTHV